MVSFMSRLGVCAYIYIYTHTHIYTHTRVCVLNLMKHIRHEVPRRSQMDFLAAIIYTQIYMMSHTRVYPKVFGMASWSENCKWYSFLTRESVICRHNPFCCFSMNGYCCLFCYNPVRKLLDTPSYSD